MSEEILINLTPMETRVALVENGMLQEVYVERTAARGIVGNIYKGKVIRVLPGMQAAFIDNGLDKACFIHAKDIVTKDGEEKGIQELLYQGQTIVTQVLKDPIGTKGARLTTQLSVPSRYLVFMPNTDHVGVSQRIDDEQERERLKKLLDTCIEKESLNGLGGFILRTAAEGVSEDELLSDLRFFKRLWEALNRRIAERKAPTTVYEDFPLYKRTVRDLVRPDVEKIRVDSRENFEALTDFTAEYIPEVNPLLELYPGPRPIFDLYAVEEEIQKALGRKIELKCGGYLIIDQTEAMTTIDINTGAFVGNRNQEETIYKTNLEAVSGLARQIKIRNLGGMIIIDFIDMQIAEHRRQVFRALEKAMASDPAKTSITKVSDLGLVEMTRKRTRESIEHILCETCPICDGRGSIKSPETVCYEIFREILREARAYEESESLMVLASQAVVDRLIDEESASVADLEMFINKTIQFQVESLYGQEQFDVIIS